VFQNAVCHILKITKQNQLQPGLYGKEITFKRMKMKYSIGIDLGGTRIKAAVIDESGIIHDQKITDTRDDAQNSGLEWKNAILQTVTDLKMGNCLSNVAIGISAPGIPDHENKSIAFMPGRMQGLENFLWNELLGQPVFVLNDAVAALMAEAKFGAAKDKQHVVLLTLGTGVGGAILINGMPYQGAFNKAGHIGHMVIDHKGEKDVTGMPGSLEECIGNYTVQKRSGGKYDSTRDLVDAYRKGETLATEVWLRSVEQLAIGLASITNILSPEVIVIGGGIAEVGTDLFEPLAHFMDEYEWRAGGNKAEIVKAVYGDIAGTVGAAGFAMAASIAG
jgi:glucokinase